MAKSVHNDVIDAALDYVKTNCTRITLCSSEPTTFAEANSTFALADVTVDATDFTIAAGDVSGRKLTVAEQLSFAVDTTGTATHVALLDVSNSKLLYVTTTTSTALTASRSVNLLAFDIEILKPS